MNSLMNVDYHAKIAFYKAYISGWFIHSTYVVPIMSQDTHCFYGNGSCGDAINVPIGVWLFYLEGGTHSIILAVAVSPIHSNMSESELSALIKLNVKQLVH